MRPIVFFDPVCPKPYTSKTLQTEPLGGTEATVIRVAKALDAHVLQHNSTNTSVGAGELRYLNWDVPLRGIEHVVVLRHPQALLLARARFPKAKLYLWLHDVVGSSLVHNINLVRATGTTLIAVSDWHAGQIRHTIESAGIVAPAIIRIYNPVEDSLQPDQTPVDPGKLVFFSAAHKGLEYALQCFKELSDRLTLYVANPGYKPLREVGIDGTKVVNLGALPHAEIIRHVREALCVFYPNMVFPETFGLVLAEANAVGTPVITHPIGAAPEVLNPADQCIDCSDPKEVIKRTLSYRLNRPTVSCKPHFRLSAVISDWNKLLTKVV